MHKTLVQGSQLPEGLLFGGKYVIQQDRQRSGSAATVLAHQAPAACHGDSSEQEDPTEVICTVPCCAALQQEVVAVQGGHLPSCRQYACYAPAVLHAICIFGTLCVATEFFADHCA